MAEAVEIITTRSESIRLECLRLTHRHDLDPERAVDRAKVLEAYVTGGATLSQSKAARGTKKDNPLS